MPINLTSPPDKEPITVPQAKLALRVTDSENLEDEYISGLITMAREIVEYKTGRALISQTWQATYDSFPCSRIIHLERGTPLIEVDFIKYLDFDLNLITWDPANYRVSTVSSPGRVILRYGFVWPITAFEADCVTIQYTSGYGEAADRVPAALLQAMYFLIAHFYANREPVITGLRAAAIEVPETLDLTLYPYKVYLPQRS